jgi:sulfite reductase (NADPH) flavoprotein alpha-component
LLLLFCFFGGKGDVAQGGGSGAGRQEASFASVTQVWECLLRTVPGGYASATLRFPRRGGDVQVVYLDPQPAHSRARNTLSMNASGEVIWHERYDDKPPNARLLGSISVYLCRFS